MARRKTLEEELHELAPVAANPRCEEAPTLLRAALQSKRSHVAARAAGLIKRHLLEGYAKDLTAAFTRFLDDPVKSDPGCAAKFGAIEALDYTEHMDPAPFLVGVRHIQLEPSWGPPVDTAPPLRSRSALALARLHHEDLSLILGELMNDKEPPCRQAAADALGLHGDRSGAALLLFKLRLGDEDPLVTLACMSALISLAPDFALATLRPMLAEGNELAALALGQSKRDDAAELLCEALADCAISKDRALLIRGLALHRSDRALAALLDLIANGSAADATAVQAALEPRYFEPGLEKKVRDAVKKKKR